MISPLVSDKNYFCRYDCFFLARDGFVKKLLQRECEKGREGFCGIERWEEKREREVPCPF